MRTRGSQRTRSGLVTALLLVTAVALIAVPLVLRLNTSDPPDEAYAGSDSTATHAVAELDPDYRPWFSPLFEPSSAEVESGLFALQAALGAGVLGYAFGRLSGRRRSPADPAGGAVAEPAGRPAQSPAPEA
jgi:cobalt/nickel transport protein